MSSIQHLAVSPNLPTALGDQVHLELPGHDIWFHHVRTLHVVPAILDVPRFEEALSRVLQIYPHCAGKFRHLDGRWVIELTNTAIPLDIEYRLHSSSDSLLDGSWIIQDDLSPFTCTPQRGSNLNDSTPLIWVKLTFFDDETCVCVTWQHSLGDAIMVFRFLHTLSQFYQGLPMQFAAPSFKRPHLPTPSDPVLAEIWPLIPHLHRTYTFDELRAWASKRPFEHVRWRIGSQDIDELHSALSSKKQETLSKQNCITAYIIATINRSSGHPVSNVKTVWSYRHVKAPFIDENAASNMLMDVDIAIPSDIAGIATTIRNAHVQFRDPGYLYHWLMVTSNIKSEAYNALKALHFLGRDNEILINVIAAIDWWSIHFGYPDGTRFHSDAPQRNYVTVHRGNPVKGPDGVWRTPQSVEVSVGVAPEVKPKLIETVSLGVRHILKDRARL